MPVYGADAKPMATRNAGGETMDAIAKAVPELIGGAADLTSSTRTIFKDIANFHLDPAGRNIFFGVREFGMCAAVNGMAVHGGLIPFGSTFFTFSDYCKPAFAPGRADAFALAVHLHPRLDRAGRRWTDTPAHRAAHHAARECLS